MFTHVFVGSNDLDRAQAFYDATFAALGVTAGVVDQARGRIAWRTPTGGFFACCPIDGQPATAGNGTTVGFAAATPEAADAWHAAGLAHGGSACEDPPGERPGSGLYLAYLRDPDGNKLCALHLIQR